MLPGKFSTITQRLPVSLQNQISSSLIICDFQKHCFLSSDERHHNLTWVKFVDGCHFSNVQNAPDSDVKPNLLAFIPLGLSFEYNDTKLSSLFTLVNNYTG